jgi:formyltetrahydrofolate synthetase
MKEDAKRKIERYQSQGFGNLPVCVAKTQYSFSADASLKGAPEDFILPIKDVRLSAGAGKQRFGQYVRRMENFIIDRLHLSFVW